MARKQYSDEDVLKTLPEVDVHLYDSLDLVSAYRKAGILDNTISVGGPLAGGYSNITSTFRILLR